MFDNSKIRLSELSEKRAVSIFRWLGFTCHQNNISNQSNIDLIVDEKEIDVQYSFNFSKYGDIRIDLISFLERHNKNKFLTLLKDGNIQNLSQNNIKLKFGKYFDDNNMDGILYFLYNGAPISDYEQFKNTKIDGIIFIPKKIILQEILENIDQYIYKIKWNDKKKNNLSDNFLSAFIPINLSYLSNKYHIPIINKKDDLIKIKDQIKTTKRKIKP